LALAIFLGLSALSACRTIGDVNYISATNLDKEGKPQEAFNRYQSVVNDPLYPENEKSPARYRLGEMHFDGEGVARNPERALALFEEVANGPDKTWKNLARYRLGEIYRQGIPGFLEPNVIEASYWFQAAVDNGYDTAEYQAKRLARHPAVFVHRHENEFTLLKDAEAPAGMARGYELFEAGDHSAAFDIFLWHARRGNAQAEVAVGIMYRDGLGTSPDVARSRAWYYVAARNGDARAQHEIGLLYRYADAFPTSSEEAAYWFRKSADQGVPESFNELAILALYPDQDQEKEPGKALEYFARAADIGFAPALANMADLYFDGIGTPKDHDRAKALYLEAAKAGVTEARTRLFERFSIVYEANSAPVDVAAQSVAKPAPKQSQPSAPYRVTPDSAKQPQSLNLVELYASLSPSVFPVIALTNQDSASQGSAIALTETLAVTNCHVIADEQVIATKLAGDIVRFIRSRGDTTKDVCFIAIDGGLRPIRSTRAYSELKIGEKVYAIGSPRGLANTLSEGIISGLRKSDGISYIQTSAAISSGSSGGALFDEQGRLIGITTFKIRDGENLNFAIAIDEALKIMPAGRVASR